MKILTILFLTLFAPSVTWFGNFNEAKVQAATSHRLILINFSGSDWCGPCIRLRREILETSNFENFATGHLVLVRADFPRQKKNQLSKEQTKLNETLADKYNTKGAFPYTVLVDETGKVLKSWDGFPDESSDKFIAEINHFANVSK